MAAYRSIRRVSLVLQLSETFTGEPVDKGTQVTDSFGRSPVHKRGGYYVFTGEAPVHVSVRSELYHDTQAEVSGTAMSLQLVPRRELWPRGIAGCRLKIKPLERVHLYAGSRQYKLQADINAGDISVSLFKTDFVDISRLFHAPRHRERGFGKPFLITDSPGGGVFLVESAFTESVARAGCVIAPLCTLTADGDGNLVFPVPDGDRLFVFREGGVTELALRLSEMNSFSL